MSWWPICTGASTRKVDDLVKALGADSGICTSEVSRIRADLDTEVTAFRDRPLAWQPFRSVRVDSLSPARASRYSNRASSPRSSSTSRWAAASRRCNSPVSEALGHLLAPTRNSTRCPAVTAGQPASSQLSMSLKKSYTHPICPAGSQPHASSIAATRPDCAAVTSSS